MGKPMVMVPGASVGAGNSAYAAITGFKNLGDAFKNYSDNKRLDQKTSYEALKQMGEIQQKTDTKNAIQNTIKNPRLQSDVSARFNNLYNQYSSRKQELESQATKQQQILLDGYNSAMASATAGQAGEAARQKAKSIFNEKSDLLEQKQKSELNSLELDYADNLDTLHNYVNAAVTNGDFDKVTDARGYANRLYQNLIDANTNPETAATIQKLAYETNQQSDMSEYEKSRAKDNRDLLKANIERIKEGNIVQKIEKGTRALTGSGGGSNGSSTSTTFGKTDKIEKYLKDNGVNPTNSIGSGEGSNAVLNLDRDFRAKGVSGYSQQVMVNALNTALLDKPDAMETNTWFDTSVGMNTLKANLKKELAAVRNNPKINGSGKHIPTAAERSYSSKIQSGIVNNKSQNAKYKKAVDSFLANRFSKPDAYKQLLERVTGTSKPRQLKTKENPFSQLIGKSDSTSAKPTVTTPPNKVKKSKSSTVPQTNKELYTSKPKSNKSTNLITSEEIELSDKMKVQADKLYSTYSKDKSYLEGIIKRLESKSTSRTKYQKRQDKETIKRAQKSLDDLAKKYSNNLSATEKGIKVKIPTTYAVPKSESKSKSGFDTTIKPHTKIEKEANNIFNKLSEKQLRYNVQHQEYSPAMRRELLKLLRQKYKTK